jgi:hypothetical protein
MFLPRRLSRPWSTIATASRHLRVTVVGNDFHPLRFSDSAHCAYICGNQHPELSTASNAAQCNKYLMVRTPPVFNNVQPFKNPYKIELHRCTLSMEDSCWIFLTGLVLQEERLQGAERVVNAMVNDQRIALESSVHFGTRAEKSDIRREYRSI